VSTLDRLTATGSKTGICVPGSRGKTGAPRSGTGSRQGTAALAMLGMKDALTDTLVKQMRARFTSEATGNKQQDLIGKEVVAFMASNGSMKAEDISGLEERIRNKLAGGTGTVPAALLRKKENDEWAMLAKFEEKQAVIEELRRKEAIKENKLRTKAQLDMQMDEAEEKRQADRDLEDAWAAEERRALEVWKLEEADKMKMGKDKLAVLKVDRDAQILDRKMRVEKAVERRKQEDEQSKEIMRLEHRKKVEEEQQNKAHQKIQQDQFKEGNEAQLDLQMQAKAREQDEDKYYALLALKEMDKRDGQRQAQKDKVQKALDDNLRKADLEKRPRPLKRWMDEKVIERNFLEREAELDMKEEEAMKKVHSLNLEQRRVLAMQLKEKEERKKLMAAAEKSRHRMFATAIKESDGEEVRRKAALNEKRTQIKEDLEAQMREKAMRDDNPTMSNLERTINRSLLARVKEKVESMEC